MEWWQVVLTSALSSAVVAGLVAVSNAYFDRKTRIKELQFKIAFELAHERAKMVLDAAKSQGTTALIQDPIYTAQYYHEWVKHFYEHGKLPSEALKIHEDESKKYGL